MSCRLQRLTGPYGITRKTSFHYSTNNWAPVCMLRFLSHIILDRPMQGIAVRHPVCLSVCLLCAQVNSASYPQRGAQWVAAYGLRGEGLVWLIGAVVCLLNAPRVQLFAGVGNGWPHNSQFAAVSLYRANPMFVAYFSCVSQVSIDVASSLPDFTLYLYLSVCLTHTFLRATDLPAGIAESAY